MHYLRNIKPLYRDLNKLSTHLTVLITTRDLKIYVVFEKHVFSNTEIDKKMRAFLLS